MKKIIWEIEYLALPVVVKYCKKCGKISEFICSQKFRVNAQKKNIDVWLIYNCDYCNTTWNARVYQQISTQSIEKHDLDGFYQNSKAMVKKYAMDYEFLCKNGADGVELPPYTIMGEDFSLTEIVELQIKNRYKLPVKISKIIREKLYLSQSEYLRLIENGDIKSVPEHDLKKCKIKKEITLIFKS